MCACVCRRTVRGGGGIVRDDFCLVQVDLGGFDLRVSIRVVDTYHTEESLLQYHPLIFFRSFLGGEDPRGRSDLTCLDLQICRFSRPFF